MPIHFFSTNLKKLAIVKVTIWIVGLAPREKATKSIVAVAYLMHHFRDEMHFKNFNHSLLALLKFTCTS